MARTSPRQLLALAATLRAVVQKIVDGGGPKSRSVDQALAAVEASARGDKITKRELDRLAKAASKAAARYGVHSPPPKKAAYWAWAAVGTLAWSAARARDESEHILTHASYGWLDEGAEPLERSRAVRELYDAARAASAKVSSSPIAAPAAKVDPRAAGGLATSRKALGKHGKLLDKIGAARDPKGVAPRAKLIALLQRKRYTPHPAVLAFDAQFGGLLLPQDADEDWRELGEYALVGTYACLRSGAHSAPRGARHQAELQLVPIIYCDADSVIYLDKRGRAYAEDTVGDPEATAYRRDGRAALVALLESLVATR